MGRDVRIIILNGDEEFGLTLRAMLLSIKGVKVIAEVEEPALLTQAVQQFPVDILLVNLDPNPDAVLPLVGNLAGSGRDVVVFAVSDSTDGQLILRSMRMGVKEFLPKPLEPNALEEAIERAAVDRTTTAPQGTQICIVGTSGGVGTTMITTNLAVELAAIASGKVTVVDLDYRYGQVATFLDVEPKHTLADLCGSPEALEPQVIEQALTLHDSGVQVLGRPNYLAEADTITAAACIGVFSSLITINEYVISDGPTRSDVGGKSVLALSDLILLVVQAQVPCIRNAVRLTQSMREAGYSLDRVQLICNRIGRGSGHLSENDITETLGLKMFASIPDDWETASGAINLGEPLITNSPKSKLRVAIQEIADRLHSADSQTDEKEAHKQSLIGRIFAGS